MSSGSIQIHRLAGALPKIVAHRGISLRAPENTLAAFQLAVDAGADLVEMDVHLTADDRVVVIHDRTLQRTTTGNGAVRSYTAEELRDFDAGSWFHPSFASERVPLLEDVLDLIRGRCWADIELKSHAWHREPKGHLERRTLDAIRSCRMLDQVMISSFDHSMLKIVRSMDASIPTGILHNWPSEMFRSPSSMAAEVGASAFICGRHQVSSELVQDAHGAGVAVYVYTVNDTAFAERVSALPVDGIISDSADVLLQHRAAR